MHTLGEANGTVVQFTVTTEPWALDTDALVIPAAAGLGSLGRSFLDAFPDLEPVVMKAVARLPPDGTLFEQVTPSLGLVIVSSTPAIPIAVATRSAIRLAMDSGVTGLALPLIGTGDREVSKSVALREMATAVRAAVAYRKRGILRRVVLFDRSSSAEELLADTGHAAVPAVLAGGVDSDLVKADIALDASADRLDVMPYVRMIAGVIARRDTPVPLCVGVFGAWGSGKSYFMALLRGRITALQGTEQHCGHIVHIGFNAWHYADANLWASIADAVFDGLGTPDSPAGEREAAGRELAAAETERSRLDEVNARASEEVARLEKVVEETEGRHLVTARDVLTAITTSDVLAARLDRAWEQLGITEEVDRAKVFSKAMRGIYRDYQEVKTPETKRKAVLALVAAGIAAMVALGGFLAPWLFTALGPALGLGWLSAAWAGRAKNGLIGLMELRDDLRNRLTEVTEARDRAAIQPTLDRLREVEAEQRVASTARDTVVERVSTLTARLVELDPALRFETFRTERLAAYTPQLTAVSHVRRDFDELVDRLADWRAAGDRPIDRIVLYIDDLDRCPPGRVVEVLEAVHLLMTLDLFLVVIGVDPRWLVRAVRGHYAGLVDSRQATPEDYLEKIINIPFTLPRMGRGGLPALLRSLVDPVEEQVAPVMFMPHGAGLNRVEPRPTPEYLSVAEPVTLPPRGLGQGELAFLDALDLLITTPRAAKRLANVYRMLRSSEFTTADDFLGDNDRPGEYQAVVILLGILTASPALAGLVFAARPGGSVLGGLLYRPAGSSWAAFAADLVDGARIVVDADAGEWGRLHRGLVPVTNQVTLADLAAFQRWIPRVRRFSYLLDV